jgi:ribA/ribD-fused uncharacterized protein
MSEHVNIENDEVTIPHYAVHKDGEIHGFFGQFRFLSNFYILENGVTFEELTYPSVEHAYQAAKWPQHGTHQYESNHTASRLAFLDVTAAQSKRLGRLAPNFDARKWNKKKVEIMRALVFQKFQNNIKLRKMLMAMEGYVLTERNSWGDVFWGTNEKGEGENTLGKMLMAVRDKFIEMENKEKYW